MKRQRKVRVGHSPLGWGVFSQRAFCPQEIIGELRGTVIDDPEYGSPYGIDLGGNLTLEPSPPFRFLNHSCRPNCGLFLWETERNPLAGPRVLLQALTCIEPAEELTIDYAWPAESAIPCGCQSPGCRGWIVDPEEMHKLTVLAEASQ